LKLKYIINAVLITLFIYVFISGVRAHIELKSLESWRENVSEKLVKNENKLNKLKNMLKLTKNKSYLIDLAREKLYMKKPDETIIPVK